MGVAQAIATFQVYASNRELWERMVAVAAAGFLPVPNEHAMPTLLRWKAACGGLGFLVHGFACGRRHPTANNGVYGMAGGRTRCGRVDSES